MVQVKDGQLLYHLTALDNLDSIFKQGLQSRAAMVYSNFIDVADNNILTLRKQHGQGPKPPFLTLQTPPRVA